MSFVPLAIAAGVWYHLSSEGSTTRTIWLALNTLDTLRALREVRPGGRGRRIGQLARRKAMREALMCWIVFGIGTMLDKVLCWVPAYSLLRGVGMTAFMFTRVSSSSTIYASLIRPALRKYETPLDLTILLIHSLIMLVYHYLIQLPLHLLITSLRSALPAVLRHVRSSLATVLASSPSDSVVASTGDSSGKKDGDQGDVDLDALNDLACSLASGQTERMRRTVLAQRGGDMAGSTATSRSLVQPRSAQKRVADFDVKIIDLSELPERIQTTVPKPARYAPPTLNGAHSEIPTTRPARSSPRPTKLTGKKQPAVFPIKSIQERSSTFEPRLSAEQTRTDSHVHSKLSSYRQVKTSPAPSLLAVNVPSAQTSLIARGSDGSGKAESVKTGASAGKPVSVSQPTRTRHARNTSHTSLTLAGSIDRHSTRRTAAVPAKATAASSKAPAGFNIKLDQRLDKTSSTTDAAAAQKPLPSTAAERSRAKRLIARKGLEGDENARSKDLEAVALNVGGKRRAGSAIQPVKVKRVKVDPDMGSVVARKGH